MERSEVYQIWEKGCHYDNIEHGPENYAQVFASKADAQLVADACNERAIVRELMKREEAQAFNRAKHEAALEANKILTEAGLDIVVPVPKLRDPETRSQVISRLSTQEGWLYVESIELVPHSKPEPEVCHFCAETIIHRGNSGGAWVTDEGDYQCGGDPLIGHAPDSSFKNDHTPFNQVRSALALDPLP